MEVVEDSPCIVPPCEFVFGSDSLLGYDSFYHQRWCHGASDVGYICGKWEHGMDVCREGA